MHTIFLVQSRSGRISALWTADPDDTIDSINAWFDDDRKAFGSINIRHGSVAMVLDAIRSLTHGNCAPTIQDTINRLVEDAYKLGLEHGKNGTEMPFGPEKL